MLKVGTEPTTLASHAYIYCISTMLYQLSYLSKRAESLQLLPTVGVEPTTLGLKARRSTN